MNLVVQFLKHLVEELGKDALQGIFEGFIQKHNIPQTHQRDLVALLAEQGIDVAHSPVVGSQEHAAIEGAPVSTVKAGLKP